MPVITYFKHIREKLIEPEKGIEEPEKGKSTSNGEKLMTPVSLSYLR